MKKSKRMNAGNTGMSSSRSGTVSLSSRIQHRILTVLSAVVVFCTAYSLILPAVTASADLYCDLEEHTHSEDCYKSEVPLRGYSDDTDGADSESGSVLESDSASVSVSEHVHISDCYISDEPLCGLEEHIHSMECESDPDAVETQAEWEELLPDISGYDIAGGIAALAKSQIGYEESTSNFIMDSNWEKSGFTRYGAFAGDSYGDWGVSFVNFILYYAGIAPISIPEDEESLTAWLSLYSAAEWLEDSDSGTEFGTDSGSSSDSGSGTDSASPSGFAYALADLLFVKNTYSHEIYMGFVTDTDPLQVVVGDRNNAVEVIEPETGSGWEVLGCIRFADADDSNADADVDGDNGSDESDKAADDVDIDVESGELSGSITPEESLDSGSGETDDDDDEAGSDSEADYGEPADSESGNSSESDAADDTDASSADSESSINSGTTASRELAAGKTDEDLPSIWIVPIDENGNELAEPIEVAEEIDFAESVFGDSLTAAKTVEKTGAEYSVTADYVGAFIGSEEVSSAEPGFITIEGQDPLRVAVGTTIYLQYEETREKTVYEYESKDKSIHVTATASSPDTLPDDAKLVVTEVTEDTSGYNYSVYRDAAQEAGIEEDLVLLDLAFYAEDVNGNPVEVQPETGTVSFSIESDSLSPSLEAQSAFNSLVIAHLPVSDEAAEATTYETTDISMEDIETELVTPLSTSEDEVEITLNNFSIVAVGITSQQDQFTLDGGSYDLEYLLNHYQLISFGNASGQHLNGPVLVGGSFKDDNNGGWDNDSGSAATTPSIILGDLAAVRAGGNSSGAKPIYLGSSNSISKTDSTHWSVTNCTKGTFSFETSSNRQVIINDNYINMAALKASLKTQSSELAQSCREVASYDIINYRQTGWDDVKKEPTYTQALLVNPGDKIKISTDDLSKLECIKFNWNVSSDTDPHLTVITITGSSLSVFPKVVDQNNNQISVTDVAKYGTSVVFDLPEATSVNMGTSDGSSIIGHILAPYASVTNSNSGSNFNGTVVGQSISLPNMEGHMYFYISDNEITNSVRPSLGITKYIDGAPADGTTSFKFKLQKWDSSSNVWSDFNTTQSQSGNIYTLTWGSDYTASDIGTYYFKLTEDLSGDNSSKYENNQVYYIQVVVRSQVELKTIDEQVTRVTTVYQDISLYSDEEFTNKLDSDAGITFDNKTKQQQYILPETGGTGTGSLYIAGGMMFAAGLIAAAWFCRKSDRDVC